jgi:U4/U6.U5 tri-snRNP-associated protein 3
MLGEEEIADAASTGKKRQRNRDASRKSNNDSDDGEEEDEEQNEMMQMLGFGGFGSTKGKAVADNQMSAAKGAASKNKGRKYRQYMNRKGGFNRPLDKMN